MSLYTLIICAFLQQDAQRIQASIAGLYTDQPALELAQEPQVFAPL